MESVGGVLGDRATAIRGGGPGRVFLSLELHRGVMACTTNHAHRFEFVASWRSNLLITKKPAAGSAAGVEKRPLEGPLCAFEPNPDLRAWFQVRVGRSDRKSATLALLNLSRMFAFKTCVRADYTGIAAATTPRVLRAAAFRRPPNPMTMYI